MPPLTLGCFITAIRAMSSKSLGMSGRPGMITASESRSVCNSSGGGGGGSNEAGAAGLYGAITGPDCRTLIAVTVLSVAASDPLAITSSGVTLFSCMHGNTMGGSHVKALVTRTSSTQVSNYICQGSGRTF